MCIVCVWILAILPMAHQWMCQLMHKRNISRTYIVEFVCSSVEILRLNSIALHTIAIDFLFSSSHCQLIVCVCDFFCASFQNRSIWDDFQLAFIRVDTKFSVIFRLCWLSLMFENKEMQILYTEREWKFFEIYPRHLIQ